MRLIDADKPRKALLQVITDEKRKGHATEDLEQVVYFWDACPTVDAVPVVRCKDCKSAYINSFSAASGVAVCRRWSNAEKTIVVQHDDFCSYGERKNNGICKED